MQQLATRPWTTAAVALLGAGAVAAAPVVAPLPGAVAIDMPDGGVNPHDGGGNPHGGDGRPTG